MVIIMKKRLLTVLLAVTLCIALVPVATANHEERGILRYEEIIKPQYEAVNDFSEDLAAVKKDGKWGYIDTENNIVIPFQFDMAQPFSEGYAIVGKLSDGYYEWADWETGEIISESYYKLDVGCIDKSGKHTPFRYYAFDDDTYEYRLEDFSPYVGTLDDLDTYTRQRFCYYGGWVIFNGMLFDKSGAQLITPESFFENTRHVPTEGIIATGLWGEISTIYRGMNGATALDLSGFRYYDTDGNQLPYVDYDFDNYDDDSYNKWLEENEQYFDVVRYEKYITDIFAFNQGLAPVYEAARDKYAYGEAEYAGFIDRSGKFVIEPQFNSFWRYDVLGEHKVFNDGGLASVSKEGWFGAIDKNGHTVVPFQYGDLMCFVEGLAGFVYDGYFGFLDTSGNHVIPARYFAVSNFRNGIAAVIEGNSTFLIDRKGRMIPGSDKLDLSASISQDYYGRTYILDPSEYFIISDGEKYGFGKISYTPLLPDKSEMDEWAYTEVIAALEADLVPVNLWNMFRSNITRVDYCSLVVETLCAASDMGRDQLVMSKTGKSMTDWIKENPFNDTANKNVIAASALGLVQGYGDATFRPYNHILRQEAAVLLWRAAEKMGMNTNNPPVSGFVDRDKIPAWAVKEVDYVSSIGVMMGVGANTFAPTYNYTRQQSYMTIYRLLVELWS